MLAVQDRMLAERPSGEMVKIDQEPGEGVVYARRRGP
jgi:hypothetical protein